ncbi:MAG: hypothetical protein JO112_07010, partial [Planctomycetes bacterium]|nr:hypothetical protein [Planctomycetota bacterium]
ARSSGILAESLAAGLPVLVPAGTWLSRQIVDPIYRHRLELARVMTSLEIRAATDLPLRTVGTPETTPVRGKDPIAGQGKNGVMAELDRPPAADFLLISFALEEQTFDPLVEVALDQHDQAGLPVQRSSQWLERGRERSPCAWLVPLRPETRWLVLAFRNPLSPSPILLVHLQAQFLHASCEAASLPTGQVGLVYTTLEDIPALVAEMVEHWPHYRETAAAHAAAWVQLHNAQRLLECLDTRHPARPPVPHRAGLESVGGTR